MCCVVRFALVGPGEEDHPEFYVFTKPAFTLQRGGVPGGSADLQKVHRQ